MNIQDMQNLSRNTIRYICAIIKPNMLLSDIKDISEKYLLENGADSFWYWDIGAFIFSGRSTKISISGREYEVENKIIGENDIITIDLSPQNNNVWGDYSRTIIIEHGKVIENLESIYNKEWRKSMMFLDSLHEELFLYATEYTTFEDLYFYMNEMIIKNGYANLDFSGNLGHSIEKNKGDRIYIERGNKTELSKTTAFTFEPHISLSASEYGFKKENIYSFENGKIIEL